MLIVRTLSATNVPCTSDIGVMCDATANEQSRGEERPAGGGGRLHAGEAGAARDGVFS